MKGEIQYHPRIADNILRDKLEAKGAVLIRGPKWCGKTTTAEQQAASVLYMSQPDTRAYNLELAKVDPQLLLEGATPRLIEEGCKNLHKLNSIIDTSKMSEPSFMMILTAVGSYAYRRSDGIYIVPIGCLRN